MNLTKVWCGGPADDHLEEDRADCTGIETMTSCMYLPALKDDGDWEAENLALKGKRGGFTKCQPVTQRPLSISEIFTV